MDTIPTESAQALRQRAEEKLKGDGGVTLKALSPGETERLLHELQVHQAELEIQNEELRRTQQDLEASRDRYIELYDLAPVGYLTLGTQGVIRKANLAAAALLGLARMNVLNKPLTQFIFSEDQDVYYLQHKKVLETNVVQHWEMRMVKADGSPFWVHIQGIPARDGECWITVADITERMRAVEALKQLNEELESRVTERTGELVTALQHVQEESVKRIRAVEAMRKKEQMLIQQSRQAAMGEMIGNIAHQWRQPLNTLGLIIQSLRAFHETPDFTKEFLDESVTKSMEIIQHMSKTIDDFRNYFKPEKEKADFNVCEAVASTVSLLEGSMQHPKISLEIISKDNPVVHGYQNEFAQVIINIVVNARDAIIEKGIADPKVIITIGSEDGSAVVTISDNAGGVPEEIMGKLFEPYFTTKGPDRGTGVGLFMSKAIIEKNMGGRISVRNSGRGAEFRIEMVKGIQS